MTESTDDRWSSFAGMPNGIVPLKQTTAELLIGGMKTSLSASIVLRLSNEPGMMVQLSGPRPPLFGIRIGEKLTLRLSNEAHDLKGFIKS